MFTGQWEFTIMILGNSIEVSIPMILIWILLFLFGLTFILSQIQVTYTLPSGGTIVGNIIQYFFSLFWDGLKKLAGL